MGERRQNAEQRRLSQVRALKETHFPTDATVEEQLAEKDRRIEELEREVDLLRLKLSRTQPIPDNDSTNGPTNRYLSESDR